MGLFSSSTEKPTRAERRAENKEAKAERRMAKADAKVAAVSTLLDSRTAKADAKVAAARQKAQDRIDAQTAKLDARVAKAEDKAQKSADKKASKQAPKAKKISEAGTVERAEKVEIAGTVVRGTREPITAKSAMRLIAVGKVVAPVVTPVVLTAVNTVRSAWDSRRANRLGVTPDQLSSFAGPGGALHARLSHVADALTKLESTSEGADAKQFADRTRPRLADLSVAVRAAEQMPAGRRRAAYKAIGHELDTIESTLLQHLGVSPAS